MSVYCLLMLPVVGAPATASTPTLAERAGDAAIADLIDTVLGQVTLSRRRLSTELAALPEAERSLRAYIAQTARLSPARVNARGRTVRDAEITVAQINEHLAHLAARDPYLLDIRRLRLTTAAPQISARGSVHPEEGPFADQPGWRHCPREQIARVRAAAEEDLRLNLLVALSDLRTASDQSLGELLARDESARRRLQQELARLPMPEVVLEPSGVCHLRLALPRRQVAAILEAALRGQAGTTIDWPRLTGGIQATLTVDGYAVAPPRAEPMTGPAATEPGGG